MCSAEWETCGRCEQSQKKRRFYLLSISACVRQHKREQTEEPVRERWYHLSALLLTIIDVSMDRATCGQMKITITQERVCTLILCKSSISEAPRRQWWICMLLQIGATKNLTRANLNVLFSGQSSEKLAFRDDLIGSISISQVFVWLWEVWTNNKTTSCLDPLNSRWWWCHQRLKKTFFYCQ